MSTADVKSDKRIVGAGIARHDAIEKVQGRTVYAADFALPRMLHAMLKRSDYAHARLLGVDTSAADAIDGVVAVYTAADVPQNTVSVDVPGQTLEVGALKAISNVLADGVVRYHGEPVALVAAESEDAALAARDAIVVEYEPLPVIDDPERALDDDAPELHDGGNLLAHWELEEGDVAAGLGAAAAVVEEEYRTQFIDHAYLEPEAGVAWRDTDGVITIRAATQVVEHFRDVARILDLPDNKVRLITPYVGGGFGGKEDMTVEPYLGIVAALTGRPVRMIWSRQESLTARQNRHAVRMRYRTGADADGRLVAMDIDILSDGGAYALLSALVLLYSTTCAAGPYRCPNVRISARTVYTNHTPCSAMRGFGGMQVTLGYEG
ncbi:MAG: xanthine dehydrogenase family protein molybdopterin-binding subunit, partial [Acidobacteria bacterium]